MRIINTLTKTHDYNPQLICTFTAISISVNIVIYDITNGQNTPVTIASSGCYAIGNTGRWGWSTENLPITNDRDKYHYCYTMISNTGEEQYGEALIYVPERGVWSFPN